jgi:hypothetical protein
VTNAALTSDEMTERELEGLRRCLAAAIDGRCIPEWEFEALVGCTRQEARGLLDVDLALLEHDEQLLDRAAALLGALSGAALLTSCSWEGHDIDLAELHTLLARVLAAGLEDRPERVSSVSLRAEQRDSGPTMRRA